ncbi:MAG: acyl carrier protein [Clostridiales bacterium]|nr:acyl carrier protein [Clostridiales bacterium]
MEEIRKILESMKPGVDFSAQNHMIDDHILESMDVMMLVAELNDAFDVEITLPYIRPENFQSIDTIYDMIQRIEEED